MIDDLSTSVRTDTVAALTRLPQPLHLFAALTRSRHYHFGWFNGGRTVAADRESLGPALDRLAIRAGAFLRPRSRVLDVGCGLGGTAERLARAGHAVLGIDPSEPSIAYARAVSGAGARFRACSLHELDAEEEFDALVLIESAHRFSALDPLLSSARTLLRPGGVLVVQDVVLVTGAVARAVPFHPRGALARRAGAFGFHVQHVGDLTARVAPTLPLLARCLEVERPALIDLFRAARPRIEAEIAELAAQLAHLDRAIAGGHLVYEETVLRAGPRA